MTLEEALQQAPTFYSDVTLGDKIIILQVITNVTWVLNVYFLETWPFEMLYLEFVNELCGNFIVYYLGVYR